MSMLRMNMPPILQPYLKQQSNEDKLPRKTATNPGKKNTLLTKKIINYPKNKRSCIHDHLTFTI